LTRETDTARQGGATKGNQINRELQINLNAHFEAESFFFSPTMKIEMRRSFPFSSFSSAAP